MLVPKLVRRPVKVFAKEVIKLIWKAVSKDKLTAFKNKHAGEDCFIIGNGPSLNKMDLTILDDYYTFGLNKIFLMFDRQNFDLTYHVCVNGLVIKQSKQEIKNLDCPSFVSFTPSVLNGLYGEDINYILHSGDIMFSKDIVNDLISCSYTVTYTAMQLAHYMGFSRVFLIGVDHSFSQKGNPNETQKMEEEDVNHFDPNYFKGQKWQLADLKNSEICYFIAKQNFEEDGCKIIDATVDGQLQIFDKMKFEKALNLAKKK